MRAGAARPPVDALPRLQVVHEMRVPFEEVRVARRVDVECDHVSADRVDGANCGGEEQQRAAHREELCEP